MRYQRFELLAIGVGAAAVLSTLVIALRPAADVTEILAQLLLLGVLVAAIHWGRRGGTIATVCASVIYIATLVPSLEASGLTPPQLQLMLVRIATYGLVGILGGEAAGRIKYLLVRLQDDCSVDEESRIYNQRFAGRLLLASLSSFKRYGAPFSVVVMTLAPAILDGLSQGRRVRVVRAVADHLRNDVRLVDDVGRLDDGRFVVLLPQTPRDGAVVAATRLRKGVCQMIGAKEESVTATVMSASEDTEALEALVDSVALQDEALKHA